jgi:hypothetical protein
VGAHPTTRSRGRRLLLVEVVAVAIVMPLHVATVAASSSYCNGWGGGGIRVAAGGVAGTCGAAATRKSHYS